MHEAFWLTSTFCKIRFCKYCLLLVQYIGSTLCNVIITALSAESATSIKLGYLYAAIVKLFEKVCVSGILYYLVLQVSWLKSRMINWIRFLPNFVLSRAGFSSPCTHQLSSTTSVRFWVHALFTYCFIFHGSRKLLKNAPRARGSNLELTHSRADEATLAIPRGQNNNNKKAWELKKAYKNTREKNSSQQH